VLLVVALAVWLPQVARAGETGSVTLATSLQPSGTVPLSVANEVNAALDRAMDWLASVQRPDGSWSDTNYPALTALALRAFVNGKHPRKSEIVEKGVRYVLSCVQTNGGIYRDIPGRKGGGLSNYNTAICMTALHETGRPDLIPVVQKARTFVAGSQLVGDDDYRGGFGYDRDTGRAYTDLLNTYYAAEAMRLTQGVEDLRGKGEKRADINWGETVKYIERMQSKPESGADNAGGCFYNPTDAKAGTITNQAGAVFIRSYGSMTYVGLLAMLYANVSRDDTRVRSMFDWASRHWSLEENPGAGTDALYFFYHVLAKSLAAYGAAAIPQKDGAAVNWREELAGRLVGLQKVDAQGRGHWENANSRRGEGDPVLVTAYTVLALQDILP
jgi:squalene-hopene/tetraprenyl-beta-curcumene cyclase